jgi:hypothetical protein
MRWFILFCLLLAACGDDNFPKVEKLEGFRVLGIEVDNPEVPLTGGSAQLRLFVVDARASKTNVTFQWIACLDPGVAQGAPVTCDPSSAQQGSVNVLQAGLIGHGDFNYGYSSYAAITTPNLSGVGFGLRREHNGIGFLVIFTAMVDGLELRVFKRVVATGRPVNSPPTAGGILVNGGQPSGNLKKADVVSLVGLSTPEQYDYINVDGSIERRTEEYQLAWYSSSGTFNRPKSSPGEVVKYTGDGITGPELLIGVVRDERGGLSLEAAEL